MPNPPADSSTPDPAPDDEALHRRYQWAELLKRSFDLDLLTCECGAERRVIACITDRTVARKLLRHLGLPDQAPASTPSRAPPVLDFGV